MIFLYKNSAPVEPNDITKLVTRIPNAYLGDKMTGETAKVTYEGDHPTAESFIFAQKSRVDIRRAFEEYLGTRGSCLMTLEHPEDYRDSLKNTGLFEAAGTMVLNIGTFLNNLFKAQLSMPDEWGNNIGCVRLLRKKLYSPDGFVVLNHAEDKVLPVLHKSFMEFGNAYYHEIEGLASNGTATHVANQLYCQVHRGYLQPGDEYFLVKPEHWKGGTLNENATKWPSVICSPCLYAIKNAKLVHFDKKVA